MEINGILEAKFETKEFSSGFRKKEFVVNTRGEYPQLIKMEVVKDNIEKIDIRGRLYEGNYYNNILAWAVNVGATTKPEPKQTVAEDDGLPF